MRLSCPFVFGLLFSATTALADAPARTDSATPPRPTVAAGPEEGSSPTAVVVPDTSFYLHFNGEFELRGNGLSDIPLRPMPLEPDTGTLGQNTFAESWIRLRLDLGFKNAVRLVAQADFFDGVLFGDPAVGIHPARWRRDEIVGFGPDTGCDREASCQRQSSGIDPRYVFLEWQSKRSLVRIGQMGFTWGMGLVANDGDTRPFFGDYRLGDIVERLLVAVSPLGHDHPLSISMAADMVFDDSLANLVRGDRAYQGVLALRWKERRWELGALGVYRDQRNDLQDELEVGVLDLFARADFDDPSTSSGKLYAMFEGAFIAGSTTFARTVDRPRDRVLQGLFAVDLGRTTRRFDVMVESGWTSGDTNANDGRQTRASMDGDHRIGLILFPEVLAWQAARAAAYGMSPRLVGRAPRGSDLLGRDGGVGGAAYLFPRLSWRPLDWLETRVGAVLARTTTDNVDLVEQGLSSRRVNARGGSASARDLGLELDLSILAQHAIGDARVVGGIEGGVLFPGGALADATGLPMTTIGMVRLRAGLRW